MNYYDEIKNKLIDNEIYSRVKDYSKERNAVITYFEIGKLLNEAGGKYGDNIIGEYSRRLVLEVEKKYNRRTLFRMRQFDNVFKKESRDIINDGRKQNHDVLFCNLLNINGENKEETDKIRMEYIKKLMGSLGKCGIGIIIIPGSLFIGNKENGYIVVEESGKTSIDDVYACGDVVLKNVYQLVTASNDGVLVASSIINDSQSR